MSVKHAPLRASQSYCSLPTSKRQIMPTTINISGSFKTFFKRVMGVDKLPLPVDWILQMCAVINFLQLIERNMAKICHAQRILPHTEFRCYEAKTEESEKVGSHQESKPVHLWHSVWLPVTLSPFTFLYFCLIISKLKIRHVWFSDILLGLLCLIMVDFNKAWNADEMDMDMAIVLQCRQV